jgi:outer membrane lipoprotein-sorting protein
LRKINRMQSGFAIALVMLLVPATVLAQATGAAQLSETVKKLDAASAKFRSAEADFKKDFYERVVKDTTTQNGSIYFLRNGSTTQMGAKIKPPEEQVVEFKDGIVRLYRPGTNTLTTYATASNQATVESFLTLGFGGSGSDLMKSWNIDDQGQEQMSDGKSQLKVERLVLTPKQKNTFTQVTLWIDLDRGVSLKQEFVMTDGNKQTATYTNIRYNQKIDTKPYEIKCKGRCNS